MTRKDEINKASVEYTSEVDEAYKYSYKDGFIDGCVWSDNHPQCPWISVKEELPHNNPNFIHFGFTNRVLVRDKKENLFVAYMKKNKNNKWIWCNDIYDSFYLPSDITHWMYIPNMPKE